jgi:predicted dienelactone hydrolase
VAYAPFERGGYPISIRTIQASDSARDRVFPCEVWSPVPDSSRRWGPFPLIAFVHGSGGNRTSAAYLASHGYVVAAMDHSEIVAAELAGRPDVVPGLTLAHLDATLRGSHAAELFLNVRAEAEVGR